MTEEIKTAKIGWHDGNRWVMCPICRKRQFMLTPMTKIEHLWYKCKNTKCNTEFLVNV